jgi:hypothetical protein
MRKKMSLQVAQVAQVAQVVAISCKQVQVSQLEGFTRIEANSPDF